MSVAGNARRPRPEIKGDDVQKPDGRSAQNCSSSTAANVLITWPQSRWHDYLAGFTAGRAEGVAVGRDLEAAELSRIQQASARVVHAMAKLPPRDKAADRAAAERREARWAK